MEQEIKKSHKPLIIFLVETIIIVILLIIIYMLNGKINEYRCMYEEDERYIIENATTTYNYESDDEVIYIDDYTFGEISLKALKNIPKCTYNYDNLVYDGDFRYYNENDETVSHLGIDVSYFQGEIDWQQVKDSGIEFVMVRAGYRGYETGSINEDIMCREYIQGATDAGLAVGVYFYSQAVNEKEAEEEAEFVLSIIKDYDILYPVCFDWENYNEENSRTNDVDPETLTNCAKAFCNKIASKGYTACVYTSMRQALMRMDMDELAGFDFWLVEYDDVPSYPYDFDIWQYDSEAEINGISTPVDINISFVDYTLKRQVSKELENEN